MSKCIKAACNKQNGFSGKQKCGWRWIKWMKWSKWRSQAMCDMWYIASFPPFPSPVLLNPGWEDAPYVMGCKRWSLQEISPQGAQSPPALRQIKVEWNPAAPTYHTSDNDAKAAKQKSSKFTLLHSLAHWCVKLSRKEEKRPIKLIR